MSVRDGRSPRDRYDDYGGDETPRVSPYVRTGRYGRGPGEQGRFRAYGNGSGVGGVLRFLIFLVVLSAGVLVTMVTVARPLVRAVVVPWAEDSPAALKIGFVSDLVREELGAALTSPASLDSRQIVFTVKPGDTPATLAPRLAAAGLITSTQAFLYVARVDDLLPKLTAGDFLVARNLTPDQVAAALVSSPVVMQTVNITIREGLRLEQMATKLQTIKGTQIDPKAFYDIVTNPPDSLLADYPWLLDTNIRAKGASLEGFLYPATYTVRVDDIAPTTAEGLVRMMLDSFAERVGPDLMAVPAARGMTFFQVLTLASIVEQEATLDSERALIAGVYQNRLTPKLWSLGRLQSDPTVFYANDTLQLQSLAFPNWVQYVFWDAPRNGFPTTLPAGIVEYDTYLSPGLPKGPMCSPSIASILAALTPDTKAGYLYFVAKGDGTGTTAFEKTLAEHDRDVAKYIKNFK